MTTKPKAKANTKTKTKTETKTETKTKTEKSAGGTSLREGFGGQAPALRRRNAETQRGRRQGHGGRKG
jgi:hypothetical protein